MGVGYTNLADSVELSRIAQTKMLVAFMNGLRLDQVDLISNDGGTAIAQLLAAEHPQRIRSMLLTNGDVHTNSPTPSLQPTSEEARRGLLIRRLERQIADRRVALTEEGLGVVYTNPGFAMPDLVAVYLKPLAASARRRRQCQQYAVAFEPSPLPAIEAKLRTSTIPARIVWAAGDPLFTTEWAEWLDAALPASRGVRYVDHAKLFFPEKFAAVIAAEARSLWHPAGAA